MLLSKLKPYYIILFCLIASCSTNAQKVEHWLTTGDESILLEEQNTISLVSNPLGGNVQILIDSSQHYQQIDAFGFALTQGSATVINSLTNQKKSALLNELFSADGLNISGLRISIGASDLSSTLYSYNQVNNDTLMQNFSLAGPDLTDVVPLLNEILAINPELKILATPWSAPTWMKTNNSWIGGNLKADMYAAYARYFVKYIEAMNNENIQIWGITPQNEPENPNNNPSMLMTDNAQINFIENYLGPAFLQGSINTKIIVFDHNCDNPNYPIHVLNNTTFSDGAAFHLYGGNISALSFVKNSTSKNVYFTEQYTDINGNFEDDMSWHFKNVVIGSLNNWSKTVFEWNLATNANYGPYTTGGCDVCLGALTVLNPNTIVKNVSYYIIGHVSKFVRPNAVRINTLSGDPNLHVTAFKNEDASISVLIYNDNNFEETFNLSLNNIGFTKSIPEKSVATFVIPKQINPCNFSTLTLSYNQIFNFDYEETRIQSNQIIGTGITVDYDCTEYIFLKNGFEVELGGQFEALIDGCNNGAGGLLP